MPMFRGMFHVHSTLSDGAYTPAELRDMARAAGLDFIILCEHTWRLRVSRRQAALEECRQASDDSFLCMLGLECGHHGRHVVLLGPPELLCRVEAPEVVLQPGDMRDAGGLTIWAHPAGTAHPSLAPGIGSDYDGWEIWNHYVDGPVPSVPVLALLRTQRAAGSGLMALAAADYHRKQHRFVPTLGLDLPRLEPRLVLEQLRKGEFSVLWPDGSPLMDSHAQGHYSPSPAAFVYSLARYLLLRLRSCMVWLWRPTRDRLFPRPDHLLGR